MVEKRPCPDAFLKVRTLIVILIYLQGDKTLSFHYTCKNQNKWKNKNTHHNCNRTNFPSNSIVVVLGIANAKKNDPIKPVYVTSKPLCVYIKMWLNMTKVERSWEVIHC